MANASIVLGGGCFWCLDAAFRMVPGVKQVISGYAGGTKDQPTYEEVCSGGTGHAEVVKIEYDPAEVTLERLLQLFWQVHDPTQVGGQGHDIGTQYRSVAYYATPEEKKIIEASRNREQGTLARAITTEVLPLPRFFAAEEYHQDYFNRHPDRGYCAAVIRPKIKYFQSVIAHK